MTRQLFGVQAPINELIPIEVQADKFRFTPLDYQDSLIQSMFPKDQFQWLRTVNIMDTGLDRWKDEKGTAWAKRLTKYAAQNKIKLNPDRVSILSEKMGKIANAMDRLYIEFTDHAEWTAGEFGEATNSCWFGSGGYAEARKNLINRGGGAVRVFDDNQDPRARCWYWPVSSNETALFNIYDKRGILTLAGLSRLIAVLYDVTYVRIIDAHFPGAYVNGLGASYLVGKNIVQRPISFLFTDKRINVTQDGFSAGRSHTGVTTCHWCDNEYDTDDMRVIQGGNLICEGCNNEAYHCMGCGDYYPEGSGRCDYYDSVDGDVCEDCRDNYVFLCCKCDGWEDVNGRVVTRNDQEWCGSCASTYLITCTHCHNQEYREDFATVHGSGGERRVCEPCYLDMHSCEACSDTYYDQIKQTDDEVWICPDCWNDDVGTCSECGATFYDDDRYDQHCEDTGHESEEDHESS